MTTTTLPDRTETRPTAKGPLPPSPTPTTIREQLCRMVVVLNDNRMTVSLTGKDRTNIILHISELAKNHGLSIREGIGNRLQSRHGSFFLITGPRKKLIRLARELERT